MSTVDKPCTVQTREEFLKTFKVKTSKEGNENWSN